MMNPFKYGQTVSNKDYCPRNDLEKQLKSRILSNQNTYIEGERRTGKTSLITHVIRRIKKRQLVYIDLFEVRTIEDILNRILNGLASHRSGFLNELLKKTAAFRPSVTIDPITGLPSVSIGGLSQDAKPDTMNGVMDLFSGKELRNSVVVFDEFQDINKIKNTSQVLAIMRSKIQFLDSLPFIYCGSIRSEMHKIFTDHESPFFKSSLPLEVGKIDSSDFSRFLIDKFHGIKLTVSQETIFKILDICKENPGDTQQLCWGVAEVANPKGKIDEGTLMVALRHIFSTERKGYESSLAKLTSFQLKCLRTVAKIGGKNTLSKEFLNVSGITHSSTIKKSLIRLEELKILFKSNGEYRFINPFFAQWLIHKNY